jgi:tryptophan synthase beta chain
MNAFARFTSRDQDFLPENYYNIKADLASLPRPPLHPGTKQPLRPEDLESIFPKGFIAQDGVREALVPIPAAIREAYPEAFRP